MILKITNAVIDPDTFFLSRQSVCDEVLPHPDALPQALGGLSHALLQLVKAVAGQIPQLDVFEVSPHQLVRVHTRTRTRGNA